MALVKEVSVRLSASGVEDAQLKIGKLTAAAKELGDLNPTITPQIDSAKALLEARLLREGIKAELSKATADATGGGGIGGLLGKAGGFLGGTGGSGLSGTLSGTPLVGGILGSTGIYGLAGVTAAAAALLVELTGVVSGLAAAGAGVGAFGLLALPTLDKVKNQYVNLQTAQQGVVTAQKAYSDAVEKENLDPTKANAAAAATALVKLKVAQEDAAKAATPATTAISQLLGVYHQLSQQVAPLALTALTDVLKAANTLLPDMLPFATSAGKAIDGLLGKADTFFKSADFKKWLATFEPTVGPALTAIGTGLGKVTVAAGKLLTTLSSKDDVHAINIAFDSIAGIINFTADTVKLLAREFDLAEKEIVTSLGIVLGAAVDAFGWIPGIGPALKTAQAQFDAFEGHILGDLGPLNKAAGNLATTIAGIAATAGNILVPGSGQGPGAAKTGHLAAGGFGSGLTLVGEQGPELLNLPSGSYVYNHTQTQAMTAGGTQRLVLEIQGGSREFRTFLKKSIRVSGGDATVTGR